MSTQVVSHGMAFAFDEAKHLYTNPDGLILPSVTQILKAGGFIDFSMVPPAILERKRRLGTLVHKVTELYDQGEPLESFEIPDAVMEYVEGWVNFRWDSGFEPQLTEHRMLGNVHGMVYGATLDVDGLLNGEYTIIEKKCGANDSPAWQLQTAGYDLAKNGKPTAKRAACQLGPQFARGYHLRPHDEPSDYPIFSSTLASTIWKQNHNMFSLETIPEREAA